MRNISDLVNDFLNLYHVISKNFRKIFKYLQFLSKTFRNVFPCLEHIAATVRCSIATVKRATAYFAAIGWLTKIKRGYQSNMYFLNDELKNIDLDDPKTFKCADNELVNEPVLRELEKEAIVQNCNVHSHSEKGGGKVYPILEKVKPGLMTEEQKIEISRLFSENEVMHACDDIRFYAGKGNAIRSFIGLLWNRANHWKLKYRTNQ